MNAMNARRLAIWACGAGAAVVVAVLAAGLLRRRAEDEPPVHVPGVELSSVPGVSIKRVVRDGMGAGFSSGPESIEAEASLLRDLICNALSNWREFDVVFDAPVPEGHYDVEIKVPTGSGQSPEDLFKTALREVFGLATRREVRSREVFELAREPDAPLGIQFLDAQEYPPGRREESNRASDGRHFQQLKGEMKYLVSWLEEVVESPVLDRTSITDPFEITLEWDRSAGGSLIEALKQKGFRLTPARRPVEVLVIEKAR
jgi:uncharacterized protein (TIGR03435 family)